MKYFFTCLLVFFSGGGYIFALKTHFPFETKEGIEYTIEKNGFKVYPPSVPKLFFIDQNNIALAPAIFNLRLQQGNAIGITVLSESVALFECQREIAKAQKSFANFNSCQKIKKTIWQKFNEYQGKHVSKIVLRFALFEASGNYVLYDLFARVKIFFTKLTRVSYQISEPTREQSTFQYHFGWKSYDTADNSSGINTIDDFAPQLPENLRPVPNSADGMIYVELFEKLSFISLENYWQLWMHRFNFKIPGASCSIDSNNRGKNVKKIACLEAILETNGNQIRMRSFLHRQRGFFITQRRNYVNFEIFDLN